MKVCSKCGSPFGEYGVCPNCGSTQFREIGGARQNNGAQNSAQSAPVNNASAQRQSAPQGVPVNNAGAQSAPQGVPVNNAGAQYANVNVPPQNGAQQYNQNAPQGAQAQYGANLPPQNGAQQAVQVVPQNNQNAQQGAPIPPQGPPVIKGVNPNPPLIFHKTDRSFWAWFGLNIITLGIYGIVMMVKMSNELNDATKNYYPDKMMNYALVYFLLGPITLFIFDLIWWHKFCDRLGDELQRRNIAYEFSSSTFWIYDILLSFVLVGPFIFLAKLIKAMNLLNESYNVYGAVPKFDNSSAWFSQPNIVINVSNSGQNQ